jgi:hypothetical protein
MATGQHGRSGKAGIAIAQFVVILLAWMQVALAAHQFEHTIADLDENCPVCVQLDRTGDACPPAVAIPDSAPRVVSAVSEHAEADTACPAPPYQSRASP